RTRLVRGDNRMKFSEHYKVNRTAEDDWFDPVMSLDTPLFLDPFLLYAGEQGAFAGSHAEVIAFFNKVFHLVAEAKGDTGSTYFPQAATALVLPEFHELCIGYTGDGTKGSGAGTKSAELVASAIWEAILSGTVEVKHFEEIAILREGIGADRISDCTAGILR